MNVEIVRCPECKQVRFREDRPADVTAPRAMTCGGEGLERANGGQTHDWTRMERVAIVDFAHLVALEHDRLSRLAGEGAL